jgi:Tol biopolymer transport system component
VVVYSHGTQLWLVGTAAGPTPHLLVDTGVIGRPAWSPDGGQLAYIAAHDSGTYLRVAAYSGGALSGAHDLAGAGPLGIGLTGWTAMLMRTAAVAWSPDGRYLAHTGGECLGQLDYCLSVYDTATALDDYVVGFSGSGGNVTEGFANIPAFSADSGTLYLTTQHDDPDHGVFVEGPVQVVTCAVGANCWIDFQVQVGQDGDSVASPSPLTNTATLLVTGAHNGQAWVTRVRADGTRTYLYQGYGQDWIG